MITKKIDVILHDGVAPVLMTIDDTIEEFNRLIKCETCQGLCYTEIGRRYGLDILLDDNGKLYGQDTITGVCVHDGNIVDLLIGNLLISRHDDAGDSVSVSPRDMELLARHLVDGSILGANAGAKWKVAPVLLYLNC